MTDTKGYSRKVITNKINKKIDDWILSVKDDRIKTLIRNSYVLTGGAICSMLQGEEPNDYDIYFSDPDAALAIVGYYIDLHQSKYKNKSDAVKIECGFKDENRSRLSVNIKSAGVLGETDNSNYQYFETLPEGEAEKYLESVVATEEKQGKSSGAYFPVFLTSNAITLTDGIQLVFRFIGNPEEIHKNYDFVHTTNYYTESTGLVLKQDALESIMCKELRYVGSLYPVCSMFRTRKFIRRGWSINAGEMLKIAFDISNLDLYNQEVLYDQLIGVDAAYFMQLINLMKTEERAIDRTYLFELINKVFDESVDSA